MADNKYDKMPVALLPQVYKQVVERKEALENIINKQPSAELRPNQKDSDSLPDYPTIDGKIEILVDEDGSLQDCEAKGYSRMEAERVERLLYISEYKRFQSAPGTRLSPRAFWLDRRYPITNRWRESNHRTSKSA